MDNNSSQGGDPRPEALRNISETQMQELERHYSEQDRDEWNTLVQSYGWSKDQSDEVWQFFGEKPSEG
ncbi:MAG: hypothetical protein M3014_09030 [Chloroflexota bacterium]|nr:hypothetical protein [Chloroflexota bacterium]